MSESTDIFLRASRLRLRFPSSSGLLTVEDLWDLPLQAKSSRDSLESVGAPFLSKQKSLITGADSILGPTTAKTAESVRVDVSVEVLRTIAKIRQEEVAKATKAQAIKSRKAELEALLREREGKETPLEDLRKELAELSAS